MKIVLASIALSAFVAAAQADVVVETYGTQVRPATAGGYATTSIPENFYYYVAIPNTIDAFGGLINFSQRLSVRRIGLGWATWSGTYTGNVYYTPTDAEVTLTFAPGTKAVQLYAENETYATFPLTATAQTATGSASATQSGSGTAGATGWGFSTTDGSDIQSITVFDPSHTIRFAIGDIATARAEVAVEVYGTAERPDTVAGEHQMAPIPYNPSMFSTVTSTPDGFGDPIGFSQALSVRAVGLGWATWSGTYTGSVFYTPDMSNVTLTFAPGTKAVQLYAENETYAYFNLTAEATSSSGAHASSTQLGYGVSGATGWGFSATDGSDITSINVHDDTGQIRFAIGDIATSRAVPCAVDFNGDGQVDFSDYLEFLNRYDAMDPSVDFNHDGQVDFSDYLEFLNLYDAGC